MVDYVDASALVAVILKEPDSHCVDRVMRATSDSLLLSDLCVAECSSAIAINGRRDRLDVTTVGLLWDRFDAWVSTFAERTTIEPYDVQAANALVRQYELKLRAPDAIHIAAAARLGARLITLDQRMATAAKTLGIPCINPAESAA